MRSSEEAKTYAWKMTNRCLSAEESERRLKYFRHQLAIATDEAAKGVWRREIEDIENWLGSEEFKTGSFPRGIDELVLELVEWRAIIFAFQNVETETSPFKDHVFFQQWLIGGTYAAFALLGKLVGKNRRENSLRNLWAEVSPLIDQDGACSKEEIDHINRQLNKSAGRFTNDTSKAILFRNTTIAHNEKNTSVGWDEVDTDVEILVRIWSIIGSWSSFGLYEPFRTPDQAFSGLDPYFNSAELKSMKEKRQEYFSRVHHWSVHHLHNGQRDPADGIFRKLVVTTQIFQHCQRPRP